MTERKKWYSSSFVFENKRTYAKNDGKQVLLLLATGNSINAPRKPRTAKPWMQDGFITNESRNSLALPSVVIGIMVFWVSKRPSNHLPRGWSDAPRGIEPLHLIDSRTKENQIGRSIVSEPPTFFWVRKRNMTTDIHNFDCPISFLLHISQNGKDFAVHSCKSFSLSIILPSESAPIWSRLPISRSCILEQLDIPQ